MCSAFFTFQAHAELLFLLAFNRDEFFSRPTAPARFWEDDEDILGGQDLERQGTWLGVTRSARFAFLTNFREVLAGSQADPNRQPSSPSRGDLVVNFLRGGSSPLRYLLELSAGEYNGFNLVVGDLSTREVAYLTNRETDGPVKLVPGTYGISNGTLNSAWPKVFRGKDALRELEEEGKFKDGVVPWDGIFERVLSSTTRVTDDAQLPRTGLSLDWERDLSPIFINPLDATSGGLYGTRSQTVLAIYTDGHAELRERTNLAEGSFTAVQHNFAVDLSRRSSRDTVQRADGSVGNTTVGISIEPTSRRGSLEDAADRPPLTKRQHTAEEPQLPFVEGNVREALDSGLYGPSSAPLRLYTTF